MIIEMRIFYTFCLICTGDWNLFAALLCTTHYSAVQSQEAVTAYFTFGFVEQC